MSPDEFFAAVCAGDLVAVRAALDAEPHLIAAVSPQGVRPPLFALSAGHTHLADELAARSGELDAHEAAAFDDTGRLRQLLGQDPSAAQAWSVDGNQPLHLAARFGRAESVRLLLDEDAPVDPVARDGRGATPLHDAAAGGHGEIVWLLVGSGADVTRATSDGTTALHLAAERGDEQSVRALLSAGASAHVADHAGTTPAERATDAVRRLLRDA